MSQYVLLMIVRCVACRCDVASVDERGWCPGCVKKIERMKERE